MTCCANDSTTTYRAVSTHTDSFQLYNSILQFSMPNSSNINYSCCVGCWIRLLRILSISFPMSCHPLAEALSPVLPIQHLWYPQSTMHPMSSSLDVSSFRSKMGIPEEKIEKDTSWVRVFPILYVSI